MIVVGWPISRALGRRLERRGAAILPDAGVTEPLHRIEQGVEAMAIEVERISEAQRYLGQAAGAVPVHDRVMGARHSTAQALRSLAP